MTQTDRANDIQRQPPTTEILDVAAFPGAVCVRPLSVDDAAEVARLINARERRITGTEPATDDDWRMMLTWPGVNPADDTRGLFDSEGDLVAFTFAALPAAPYTNGSFEVGVDDSLFPSGPDSGPGPNPTRRRCEEALISWALSTLRGRIPMAPADARVIAGTDVSDADTDRKHTLEGCGLSLNRYFLRMRIDFDGPPKVLDLPKEIEVRTLAEGADFRSIVLASDEAFADHYGHVSRDEKTLFEIWEHRRTSNHYDPSMWYVAYAGREVAAVCICSPHDDEDPTKGYVHNLGVRRPWRQQGLAAALLSRAFAEFFLRGKAGAALHVDAQSLTGATRLYERVGMREERRSAYYEIVLRDGRETRTMEAPASPG